MHMRDLKAGGLYRVSRAMPVSESTFPIEAGTRLRLLKTRLWGAQTPIWIFETSAPLGGTLHPRVDLFEGHEPSEEVLVHLVDYLEREPLDTDAPALRTGKSRLVLRPGAECRVRSPFRAYRSMLAPSPGTLLRFDEPLDIPGETYHPFDAIRYRFESVDQPLREVKLYEIEGLEFGDDPAEYLETAPFRVHTDIQAVIESPLLYLEEAGGE